MVNLCLGVSNLRILKQSAFESSRDLRMSFCKAQEYLKPLLPISIACASILDFSRSGSDTRKN